MHDFNIWKLKKKLSTPDKKTKTRIFAFERLNSWKGGDRSSSPSFCVHKYLVFRLDFLFRYSYTVNSGFLIVTIPTYSYFLYFFSGLLLLNTIHPQKLLVHFLYPKLLYFPYFQNNVVTEPFISHLLAICSISISGSCQLFAMTVSRPTSPALVQDVPLLIMKTTLRKLALLLQSYYRELLQRSSMLDSTCDQMDFS